MINIEKYIVIKIRPERSIVRKANDIEWIEVDIQCCKEEAGSYYTLCFQEGKSFIVKFKRKKVIAKINLETLRLSLLKNFGIKIEKFLTNNKTGEL